MGRLMVAFGGLGLVIGLGVALLVHDLPAGIIGRRLSWGGYIPPDVQVESHPVSISFTWLPSLLVLPGTGLAVGVVVALVLARLGWRLVAPTS